MAYNRIKKNNGVFMVGTLESLAGSYMEWSYECERALRTIYSALGSDDGTLRRLINEVYNCRLLCDDSTLAITNATRYIEANYCSIFRPFERHFPGHEGRASLGARIDNLYSRICNS